MVGPMARLHRLVRTGPSDAPGRVVDVLGRIGLVGYGVVHLLVAWLALQVAFGVPAVQADADGAIGTIVETPGGTAVLVLGAVGMLAFVVWQLTAAAIGFRWVQVVSGSASGSVRCRSPWRCSRCCVVITNYLLGRPRRTATTASGSPPRCSPCRPAGSPSAWWRSCWW